jgi:hypothetical protein
VQHSVSECFLFLTRHQPTTQAKPSLFSLHQKKTADAMAPRKTKNSIAAAAAAAVSPPKKKRVTSAKKKQQMNTITTTTKSVADNSSTIATRPTRPSSTSTGTTTTQRAKMPPPAGENAASATARPAKKTRSSAKKKYPTRKNSSAMAGTDEDRCPLPPRPFTRSQRAKLSKTQVLENNDALLQNILSYLPNTYRYTAAVNQRFRRNYNVLFVSSHRHTTSYANAMASVTSAEIWIQEDTEDEG